MVLTKNLIIKLPQLLPAGEKGRRIKGDRESAYMAGFEFGTHAPSLSLSLFPERAAIDHFGAFCLRGNELKEGEDGRGEGRGGEGRNLLFCSWRGRASWPGDKVILSPASKRPPAWPRRMDGGG